MHRVPQDSCRSERGCSCTRSPPWLLLLASETQALAELPGQGVTEAWLPLVEEPLWADPAPPGSMVLHLALS